ncbi:MAG: phosphate acyltransferase PlsX [Simkania sp.]|nr:phosphate acyltransferase PlsX [Simkania sp.]
MQKKNNLSSQEIFRIGIDLMGCDAQPIDIAKAIIAIFPEIPSSIAIVFFGTQEILNEIPAHEQVTVCVTNEVITMDEDPLFAVRRKKTSSLFMAMKSLQSKTIDALISAGNTGALIASANLLLPKLPGIDRAALLTLLPTKLHPIAVLDVGANPSFKVQHLLQYAAMGIAYQKSRGIKHPTVGLLNIGAEAGKGTPEIRNAYQLLEQLNKTTPPNLTFIGNIEGRNVFNGIVDVLVTDGFTGNVFLKTAEGIASFILSQLEGNISEPQLNLSTLRKRLHYAEYPGAVVAGVDGVVMKCHGDGSPTAFRESLKAISRLLAHNFLEHVKSELSSETHHWSLSSLFKK